MNPVIHDYLSAEFLLRQQKLEFARACHELAALWQQLGDNMLEEIE